MKEYPQVGGSIPSTLSADATRQLREAANAHYRNLAEYDKTVLPVYLRLYNVNWQLVRELITGRRQQVEAECLRAFFDRQNGPDYLAARYKKQRGAYPSRLIYLPHEFHPVQGWCPLALDRTRRVPAGTFAPSPRPAARLAADEQAGYEYLVRRRPSNPDARAQLAADLLWVAGVLHRNAALGILLETGTPRLRQLSGDAAGNALGYVAYFLDCWRQFHAYEQTPPNPPAAAPLVEVDERLAYFDKLLADCRRAKHPHDTAQVLRAAFEEQKSRGMYTLEDFMERLPTYVLKELPAEQRVSLDEGIMRSLRGQLRMLRLRPETWPVWAVTQRGRVAERQQDAQERLAMAEPGSRGEADNREILTHLGRILAALDRAEAAGREEVRAAELAKPAVRKPERVPAGPPASPLTPEPAAGPFERLLLNFTLADLTALLVELGLLNPDTSRPTPAASPGAWVGVVHGLLAAPLPRLRNNMAATRRALVAVFGAQVSESNLQAGVSKRGSESERVRDRTLAWLAARAAGD